MKRTITIIIPAIAVLFFVAVTYLHAEGRSVARTFGISAFAAASSSEFQALPAPDIQGSLSNENDPDLVRASSSKSVDGQLIAEHHRQNMATVADSLLLIAERQDPASGLGERLRIVANDLEGSREPSTEAIEKVSYRGTISSFFLGNSRDLGLVGEAARSERSALNDLAGIRADMADAVSGAALDTARDAIARDIKILERFASSHS